MSNESRFDYVPLRAVYLASMKENERNHFLDAYNLVPSRLVRWSRFQDVFWKDVLKLSKRTLDAERAWYSIRVLVKGSRDYEINKDWKTVTEFRKFVEKSGRRMYKEVLDDGEISQLMVIFTQYQKWLDKRDLYDELDLVHRARRNIEEIRDYPLSDDGENLNALSKGFLKEEKSVWKSLSKNLQTKMYLELIQFVGTAFHEAVEYQRNNPRRWQRILNWVAKMIRLENMSKNWVYMGDDQRPTYLINPVCIGTSNRIPIWMDKIDSDLRIYFSAGLIQSSRHLFIHGFSWSSQNFDNAGENSHRFEFQLAQENSNIENLVDEGEDWKFSGFTEFSNGISDIPGTGFAKPLRIQNRLRIDASSINALWSKVSNIIPDENQLETIVTGIPILIDGMPGTGKTVLCAHRAAVWNGMRTGPRRVLMTCTNPFVVEQMEERTKDCISTMQTFQSRLNEGEKRPFKPHIFKEDIHHHYSQTSTDCEDITSFSPSENGYHEIILDECQDITPVEFELLKMLTIEDDPRRLVLAGDPLQTLNPTGFHWGRIKAMFADYPPYDRTPDNVGQLVKENSLEQNYRSSANIVKFANNIQEMRMKNDSGEPRVMTSDRSEIKERPKLIVIPNSHRQVIEQEIKDKIEKSSQTRVCWILWATDDQQTEDIVTKDRILKQLKSKNDEDDINPYFSLISVKGLEFQFSLLYKFGEKLQQEIGRHVGENSISESITLAEKFTFNRWYVSATRALETVYIIEDEEGAKFWQSAIDSGDISDIQVVDTSDEILEILRGPDFEPSINYSEENLEQQYRRFQTQGSVKSLKSAIHIASSIGHPWEYRLRGELYETKFEMEEDEIKANDFAKRALEYYQIGVEKGDTHESSKCAAKGVRLSISISSKNDDSWHKVSEFSNEFRASKWHKSLNYHIQYRQKNSTIEIEYLDINQLRNIINEISDNKKFPILPGIEIIPIKGTTKNFRFRKDVKDSIVELLISLHRVNQDPIELVKDANVFDITQILRLLSEWGADDQIIHLMENRPNEETQNNSEHVAPAIVAEFTEYSTIDSLKKWSGKLGNTPGRKLVDTHILKLCVHKSRDLHSQGASSKLFQEKMLEILQHDPTPEEKDLIEKMKELWSTLAELLKNLSSEYNSGQIGADLINQSEYHTIHAVNSFINSNIRNMISHARKLSKIKSSKMGQENRILRPILSPDWITNTLTYELWLTKDYDSDVEDLRFILSSAFTPRRVSKIEGKYANRQTYCLIQNQIDKLKPWWGALDKIRKDKSIEGEPLLFADALIHRYSFGLRELLSKDSKNKKELEKVKEDLQEYESERPQIASVTDEDDILEILPKAHTIALLHHEQDYGRDDDISHDQIKVRINLLNRVKFPPRSRDDLGEGWSQIWGEKIDAWKKDVKEKSKKLNMRLPKDLSSMLNSVDSSDAHGSLAAINEILNHSPEQIKEHKDLVIDRLLSISSNEQWPDFKIIDSKLRDCLFPGKWDSTNPKIMGVAIREILNLGHETSSTTKRINLALSFGIHRSIILTQLILEGAFPMEMRRLSEDILANRRRINRALPQKTPEEKNTRTTRSSALSNIEDMIDSDELDDKTLFAILLSNDLHDAGNEQLAVILSELLGSPYSYDKHIRIERILESLGYLNHPATIEMYSVHGSTHPSFD